MYKRLSYDNNNVRRAVHERDFCRYIKVSSTVIIISLHNVNHFFFQIYNRELLSHYFRGAKTYTYCLDAR